MPLSCSLDVSVLIPGENQNTASGQHYRLLEQHTHVQRISMLDSVEHCLTLVRNGIIPAHCDRSRTGDLHAVRKMVEFVEHPLNSARLVERPSE